MPLARAAQSLSSGKSEEALGHLLSFWRSTFDPAVGLLIERLGAHVSSPIDALPTKQGARGEALAKLATDCTDGQRSTVLAAFEVFAREANGRLVWPSIEAWAETKKDPRVARMALRVLTATTHTLTAKLWRRLVGCVEQHGDTGVVEEARVYEALLTKRGGSWGYSPERFTNVLKKLTTGRACTGLADQKTLDRMLAMLGAPATSASTKPSSDDREMIEAIVAAPDDDGPRLVYADWLTEQQRPLGEFITLQVQRARGKVSKEARAREDELLASHRKELLGPFEAVVARSGLRFERGFLVTARATSTVPKHPLTRLLQEVTFDEGFSPGARFDSLTRAVGPDLGQRNKLAAVAPKLNDWNIEPSNWDECLPVLAKLPLTDLTLRDVSRLGVVLGGLRAMKTLESITAHVSEEPQRVDFEQLPAATKRLTIETRNQGFSVTFSREAAWSAELEVSYLPLRPRLPEALEALLSGFVKAPLTKLTLITHEANRVAVESMVAPWTKAAKRVSWKKR